MDYGTHTALYLPEEIFMSFTEVDGIPGTETIIKNPSNDGSLKTDGDIILVPQPSNSVNDPLNWSKARRWWHAFLVLAVIGLTAATSNSASSAQVGLQDDLGVPQSTFNNGAGVLFLAIGYWTLLSAPSVYLYGTRPSYVIGLVFGVIGNAWYAKCRNGSDAVWSQLFIGASESVAEATAQLSLSQVFFQHKLSHLFGLYVLATSVGTFLGPLVGGFAAQNLGWPWVGWLGLITGGVLLVVVYFGLEETYFDRDKYFTKTQRATPRQSFEKHPTTKDGQDASNEMTSTVHAVEENPTAEISSEKPTTYWQRIAPFTPATNLKGWGIRQYFHRLKLMMRVFTFPAVIYSGFQWGMQDAWLTFYISTETETWTEPPYNYDDAAVALMNIPTLIGAIVGCLWGSYFSDWLVLRLAKKNNGVKEAESRLYPMLLTCIISPLGMFLFGIGTQQNWDWRISYVALGFIGFGFGSCGDLSLSYLADCYPDMILEGMVGVAVINNTLAMAFSFACESWLAIGTQNAFIAVGVVDFVIILFTVPMIMYGKRFRAWTTTMYVNFIRDRDSLTQ